MTAGSFVLVHGTGVRLPGYRSGFAAAQGVARELGIGAEFVECAWGDALGVEFAGLCLPEPPSAQQQREAREELARWSWLFDDPLFELDKLAIPDTSRPAFSVYKPDWLQRLESIRAYQPSDELTLLLRRGGLHELWPAAWGSTADSGVTARAFESSAHELPVAATALARAVVAELHALATERNLPGPGRVLRASMVERLLDDWGQVVYAPGAYFINLVQRAATRSVRRHRNWLSEASMLAIGDVLLYQSRGAAVRDFITAKLRAARPPVTIVAHSLGGIACFDLLALPDPPKVSGLVTVGSQASLLYELGALVSLKPPSGLPTGFPRWLNIYDQNDFLSYAAVRLFPAVIDVEVASGQPFPNSHSAYFDIETTWRAIKDFAAA